METKQSFLRFIEKVVILIGADFGKRYRRCKAQSFKIQ
jgi:hypothetical protein